jgi:adenylate kinase
LRDNPLLNNLVLLGPQGSGKGDQAKMLAERDGYFSIGASKAMDEYVREDPRFADIYDEYHSRGELVPVEYLMQALGHKLDAAPEDAPLVFEGVPRDLEQCHQFHQFLLDRSIAKPRVVIFTASEDTCRERLKGRCRKDDLDEEALGRRIQIYNNHREIIEEFFLKREYLLRLVDATPSQEQIYQVVSLIAGRASVVTEAEPVSAE